MDVFDPIVMNEAADIEKAKEAVIRIVNDAARGGTLSKLTPRAVRQKAEQDLGLDPGTLDGKEYKTKLKMIIQDAVDTADNSDNESEVDKGEGSSSKASKPISPPLSKLKEKNMKKRTATNGTDDKNKSAKSLKSETLVTRIGPPSRSASKTKTPTSGVKKEDAPSLKKPDVVKLTTDSEIKAYNSDSEMSVLIDEPPPKKRKKRNSDDPPKAKQSKAKKPEKGLSAAEEKVKKLKSLVAACGVRKVWAKELQDCVTTTQQISHLKGILTNLGMVGRVSLEQAKAIRERRELAQEIQDVREFAAKHAGEGRKPHTAMKTSNSKRDEESDEEDNEGSNGGGGSPRQPSRRPKVNAHRSIMAFLGDQSESD